MSLIDRVTDLVWEDSKVDPNCPAAAAPAPTQVASCSEKSGSAEKYRGARWTNDLSETRSSPKSSPRPSPKQQPRGSKKWFSFRKGRSETGEAAELQKKRMIGPNVLDPDFIDATFPKVNVNVYRKNHYLETVFHDLSPDSGEMPLEPLH